MADENSENSVDIVGDSTLTEKQYLSIFIKTWETYPELWNTSCEAYRDKEDKENDQDQYRYSISSMDPPPTPVSENKKRKKDNDQQNLLQRTLSFLEKDSSDNQEEYHLAKVWAAKLTKLESTQKLLAEKAINDILFEAQLGKLDKNSVKVNEHVPYTANSITMTPPQTLSKSVIHHQPIVTTGVPSQIILRHPLTRLQQFEYGPQDKKINKIII
ncbi:uncharacterized protein LOC123721320 [Papilio machaon]|uniref:uncharacterized protein LOC123721320 n=1 Tax=Papilio machaon TaxID=76193 RepID=UPI001E66304D|nr:uncharacterized protein LOC123721320 [Papilio machaon]